MSTKTGPFVIRGGTLLDGTGGAPQDADVVIRNGRIVEIGHAAPSDYELDATGLRVAPGFIDIHSHSDFTLLIDPRAVSALYQGVTTEVIGNCGHGCFPIRDPVLAGRAIYGFSDAVPVGWKDADGYFDRLGLAQPAVNVLSLVPNGQLRLSVIGIEDRPATSSELRAMTKLLEEALEEGAWGFSTGLEYAQERGADEAELEHLCRTAARRDRIYATHTRQRDAGAPRAVEEAVRTARAAGARLQVSHLIPRSGDDEARRCLEVVEGAAAAGDDIAFDMHTRLYGTTFLHSALPPALLALAPSDLKTRLRDTSVRRSIAEYESILSAGADWARIVLLDNSIVPEYGHRDIASIADERAQSPVDTVCDLLLEAVPDTARLMVINDCHTPAQQHEAFAHPLCMPGSDATTLAPDGPLAHAVFHGAYTWAAWFYRYAVWEAGLLSEAEAVRRMSGLPAERLGLADRGVLRPGAAADIVVFDPETFGERGTVREPNQLAVGVHHVIVNGEPALLQGTLTGVRPGQVLRR